MSVKSTLLPGYLVFVAALLVLAKYVWTHAEPPPDDQLVVSELTCDIVKGARANGE
jgi:hypothetical protein